MGTQRQSHQVSALYAAACLFIVAAIAVNCSSQTSPARGDGRFSRSIGGYEVAVVPTSENAARKEVTEILEKSPWKTESFLLSCLRMTDRISIRDPRNPALSVETLLSREQSIPTPFRLPSLRGHPGLLVGLAQGSLNRVRLGRTRLRFLSSGRVFVIEVPSNLDSLTAAIDIRYSDGRVYQLPGLDGRVPCI